MDADMRKIKVYIDHIKLEGMVYRQSIKYVLSGKEERKYEIYRTVTAAY